MEKLIVNEKYNKKKLDKFILDNLPYLSSGSFYKLLRKKDVKLNGKRINQNIELNINDEILVYTPNSLKREYNKIDIVYEDENILIINKPSNIEVTGNNSLTTKVHLNYIGSKFKPMPCHRLDRNTTGLVLYAKNQIALDILEQKFKNHEIEKHYKALVYGIPKIKSAKLEAYLFKDRKKSTVYISDTPKKGYQKIITKYSVLETYDNNTSLLDVEIETGKTHQIRAHLAHIGHPIIGDGKYGINQINKQIGFKYQQLCHYKIQFIFNTDSGILEYLNKKIFEI
ncbi:MAG: RluA family pseudouridine synthase [Clostridia bacterium]|nr:RluA family pseudouridine synthase [Clostridia bacterium]